MAQIIGSICMFLCGVSFLVLPVEKAFNAQKLNSTQDRESLTKEKRIRGIVLIVLSIVLLVI